MPSGGHENRPLVATRSLIVLVDNVSLSNPNDFTTYEFDILSRGVQTTYAVFLESSQKRPLVEGSKTLANATT